MVTSLHALNNQYQGLNLHFHEAIQTDGNLWKDFHGVYMVYLLTALKKVLRPLHYDARIEQGLQIQLEGRLATPQSDISIFDTDPNRYGYPSIRDHDGTITMPIAELLAIDLTDLDYYNAIAIRQHTDDEKTPVAWLEVLSPSNKHGNGREEYQQKRERLLRSGVVFIEADFIPRYPPTYGGIPPYNPRYPLENAAPFWLIITDPRPDLQSGQAILYPFGVDEPLPSVVIPLQGDDRLSFSLDAPYQRMFEEQFYGDKADYAMIPPWLTAYTPAHRQRIVSRLLTILSHDGPPENHPLPRQFDDLPLESALERFYDILRDRFAV